MAFGCRRRPPGRHGSECKLHLVDFEFSLGWVCAFLLILARDGRWVRFAQVLLSHGDELLLQDPASGDQEFYT